jgi:hypothetical protein
MALVSFIWLRSLPSVTALLPTNSMLRILYFGPSSMWKETFTSFELGPWIGLTSWFTVLSRKPFSASINRMTLLTLRMVVSSMNESRRIWMF